MQGLKKYMAVAALLLCMSAAGTSHAADFVVVIDPGHGGADFGAMGPRGTREKDVVLRIAKKISDSLTAISGVKVYLTRPDDEFVALEKRTEYANSINADIFVSIHANAAKRKAARGVETFFLSMDASDDETRELALYENESGEKGAVNDKARTDVLSAIIRNLESNEAHRESSVLAEMVHSKVVSSAATDRRGIKQAPFMVLNGAAMPAVLVEVGFISNRDDEKVLASDAGQSSLAKSITEGILSFKKLQASTAINSDPASSSKK